MDIALGRPVTPPAKAEKSLHEQMIAGASMKDLSDTMNEFYSCNDEMWGLVKDLPLEERKTINTMIKDYVSKR